MKMIMEMDLQRTFPRKFLAAHADMGEWAQIEPFFADLLRRRPDSTQELEHWLADYWELCAALDQEEAKRYIAMTTQTDDPAREAAFQHFVQNIMPKVKPQMHALEKAFLANSWCGSLSAERYGVLVRKSENQVALFREKNVPLEMQDDLLAKDYYKLRGAMTVKVKSSGQEAELTLQQADKLLEEPDRDLRQQVWERMAARQLADKDATEDIFDRQVALRTEIATNAGFANYRDYMFRRRERFEYTAEDCFRFHDGIDRAVMPLARKIRARQKELLRVDRLRPWDLAVDPLNRAPLKPFATTTEFVSRTKQVFDGVDPQLAEQFQFMADQNLLELENRKGKAPGGYQSSLQERRVPFIFMNAVGRDLDVRTLVHEGGHAFHLLATRDEPVFAYRIPPIEFCEVASMGMELLVLPHLRAFYKDEQEYARAYRTRLEYVVLMLPYIALVDAFQHWIYTHPHTREERGDEWLRLEERFTAGTDWAGYEGARRYQWQGKLHFFAVPFYYIEYGIAQTGALQVWMRSLRNYRNAVERYREALALGGSQPLPQLFEAAGAKFKFDYESLRPLMEAVEEKLATLPA
jgi:oligoendopeptidase F